MIVDFLDFQSFCWFQDKYAFDEAFSLFRDLHILRELVLHNANLFVGRLHIKGLKRRSPDQEGVHNDTEGPDIHFIGVAIAGTAVVYDLWGYIVWGPTDRSLTLPLEF